MLPVVDIVEIGNGGGSIAWVDDYNKLHVGPQSAGADPGPVSYGKGGKSITTTYICTIQTIKLSMLWFLLGRDITKLANAIP